MPCSINHAAAGPAGPMRRQRTIGQDGSPKTSPVPFSGRPASVIPSRHQSGNSGSTVTGSVFPTHPGAIRPFRGGSRSSRQQGLSRASRVLPRPGSDPAHRLIPLRMKWRYRRTMAITGHCSQLRVPAPNPAAPVRKTGPHITAREPSRHPAEAVLLRHGSGPPYCLRSSYVSGLGNEGYGPSRKILAPFPAYPQSPTRQAGTIQAPAPR